jgi:hypothetical protein
MSASEIASATARRKAIYLELHPETAATNEGGVFRGNQHTEVNASSALTSFTEATATATGSSVRTVETNARRGRLGADALLRIAGTALDTGVGLDSLLALSVEGELTRTLTPEGEAMLVAAEAARDAPRKKAAHLARSGPVGRRCGATQSRRPLPPRGYRTA